MRQRAGWGRPGAKTGIVFLGACKEGLGHAVWKSEREQLAPSSPPLSFHWASPIAKATSDLQETPRVGYGWLRG